MPISAGEILVAVTVTLLSGPALYAQNSPAESRPQLARGPDSALALEAAQTAIATCAANGYKVGVTVVDSAGGVRVLLANDEAAQRAVDSSTGKAFTAVTFKTSTAEVARQAAADQALAARIAVDPKLRARAGGLPLFAGTELIGAIGVGGAPGGEKDEACANAALEKIKARLK